MSAIKDGGQAFPRAIGEALGTVSDSQVGMSLRAWFAGMACSSVAVGVLCNAEGAGLSEQALAKASVRIADALIAELEKGSK